MRKRVYGAWVEPDLSHAGWQDAADSDADLRRTLTKDGERVSDDHGIKRRSWIPDPLTLLIAAESGRPILEPIFGVNEYTPTSPCPHNGPIPDGSPRYCPQCHDTGLRDHPALKLHAGDIPEPEVVVEPTAYEPPAPAAEPDVLTRKQRRAIQFNRGTDARPDAAAG